MGWLPREVLDCTPQDFFVAWGGWAKFNIPQAAKDPITQRELRDVISELENGG